MSNFDAQCIGQYTQYYIIDRADFINKIQTGMSIEEYWNIQQNTRTIYFSVGTQNFKRPFLSYRFVVNGRTFYGTSKIGYSRDIHARMAGRPCKVYFQSNNPYISCPGDVDGTTPDDVAQPISLTAMVLGMISLFVAWIPIISLLFGGTGLALGIVALRKKKTNNYFAWAGIICSGIALLIGILATILLIAIFIFDLPAFF